MPENSELFSRHLLEYLIGKTVSEVSHTDFDELLKTDRLFIYVFFTDGSVLRTGPNAFQVFAPGHYQG